MFAVRRPGRLYLLPISFYNILNLEEQQITTMILRAMLPVTRFCGQESDDKPVIGQTGGVRSLEDISGLEQS